MFLKFELTVLQDQARILAGRTHALRCFAPHVNYLLINVKNAELLIMKESSVAMNIFQEEPFTSKSET